MKQTPRDNLKVTGNTNLANFISSNMTNLQTVFEVPQKGFMYGAGHGYSVPDKFPDNTTFRGGFAVATKTDVKNYWNAPEPATESAWAWSEARHRFSLETCNGCHGGEQRSPTFPFHIFPRGAGTVSQLSSFLAGATTLVDPVDGTQLSYNEMKRREDDLHWLANELPLGNPVYGNYYKNRFQHSTKCMDLKQESTASGALVLQFDCHGRANQRLAWVDRGNHDFSLKFKHSGLCVDVENGSTADGAKVVQRPCNSAANSQKFTWFASSG